jgi:putative endonuclease
MRFHNYYIYITTNVSKTTLYVGVTNNLQMRMYQHLQNKGNNKTFAGRYHCYNLIYWEYFSDIKVAILREKEIKKWSRIKKENLIKTMNPNWDFLEP